METKEEGAPPSIAQQCFSTMNTSFPYMQQIPSTTPSLIYPNQMQFNMMMKLTNQINQMNHMKYFPQVNPNYFLQTGHPAYHPFHPFIRPSVQQPFFPNPMQVYASVPKQAQPKKAKNKSKQSSNQPQVAKSTVDRSLQGNKGNMLTREENNGISSGFDEDINSVYDINSIQGTCANADDNHIVDNINSNTNTINATLQSKCNNTNSINSTKECDNFSSQSHSVSLQIPKEEVVATSNVNASSASTSKTVSTNDNVFIDINSFTDINQLDFPIEPSQLSHESNHAEPSPPLDHQLKLSATLPSTVVSIKPIGSYYCESHHIYYITEEAYKKHLKLVHKEPVSQVKACADCSKTFTSEVSFKAHLETHANQCELCYKLFDNGNALLEHKTQYHPEMFTCKNCKVSFTTSDDLYIHSLLHYIKCTYCNRSFERKSQLQQHIKDKHHVQCNECTKNFATTLAMNAHYKDVHQPKDNEVKFTCRVCQRKFASDSALKLHIKAKKHFENKFACKEHNKTFFTQEALNCHIAAKHKK